MPSTVWPVPRGSLPNPRGPIRKRGSGAYRDAAPGRVTVAVTSRRRPVRRTLPTGPRSDSAPGDGFASVLRVRARAPERFCSSKVLIRLSSVRSRDECRAEADGVRLKSSPAFGVRRRTGARGPNGRPATDARPDARGRIRARRSAPAWRPAHHVTLPVPSDHRNGASRGQGRRQDVRRSGPDVRAVASDIAPPPDHRREAGVLRASSRLKEPRPR